MPRGKGYKKFLEELGFDLNDESVRKDIETLDRIYQQAKKAGLDKMTMEEIDEEIKAAREEAAKEKAKV